MSEPHLCTFVPESGSPHSSGHVHKLPSFAHYQGYSLTYNTNYLKAFQGIQMNGGRYTVNIINIDKKGTEETSFHSCYTLVEAHQTVRRNRLAVQQMRIGMIKDDSQAVLFRV